MSFTIRQASADDIDAIMHIETTTFHNDAWSRDAMAADIASQHTHYLVAVRAGVEAYAGLFAPRGSEQADIQTIAVAESARRNGLGRQLMTELITEATSRGAHEIFLDVRADNPNAQALYESLGFRAFATRKGYYQPDNIDAIVMRLEVKK